MKKREESNEQTIVEEYLTKSLRRKMERVSHSFNGLALPQRRRIAIASGVAAAVISLAITLQPFFFHDSELQVTDSITLPETINQNDDMKTSSENTLIPVGKMKGEVDGEFEAFYLAIDYEGQLYINREPSFGTDCYLKSSGWQAISNEEFRAYEKQLHFIPHSQKMLRR